VVQLKSGQGIIRAAAIPFGHLPPILEPLGVLVAVLNVGRLAFREGLKQTFKSQSLFLQNDLE
jgi:hypothetical protein